MTRPETTGGQREPAGQGSRFPVGSVPLARASAGSAPVGPVPPGSGPVGLAVAGAPAHVGAAPAPAGDGAPRVRRSGPRRWFVQWAGRWAGRPVLVAVLAVLLVAGCGGRATTHHKPGTGHQEATAGSGTLLAAKDEAGHRLREAPAGRAPGVRLEVRPDSEGGWNVHLAVERFRFTPESVGGAAVPGRGYARLLVDGREAARAYGPWHHVPPGARSLTVRLHADDHTVWAVDGRPVQATAGFAPTTASTAPTAAPDPPAGRTVDIRVDGTSVQPPPSRVSLKKGERLTLRVTSDRADTLHVHGYDRELPLPAGRPASLTLTVDRTGLFEVETHESGLVLTQLLVR
ncbi:hypothetical protein [Streptomyces sp. NPDC008121]|uniref:hypothetical protein n=1 Tax=Streptomyces sp. NPDC008121 TaxID=3364809 RepID=UPI0036E3C9B5